MSEIAYLLEEEIDNGENNYTITYTVTTTTTPNTPTDQPTTKTDNNYGTEQHDETELNGISESDKNKYFKKQDDGTYRINLTALAELFPSVNDLSTITVSQIKEALKGKTLKLENITGYTNNDKVENTDATRNSESTRAKANEVLKGLINKIKTQLMNYIISQLGYSISSTELDTTIDKIINDKSSSVYKAITSDNFTYSFNTKDTIDAFIKDIDTYLADKNNNPSLKSYSSNEVQKAGFGDLINNETYFTNDGNSYKLNIELLNDKNNAPVDVKAYIQNGGRITDLESLRKAIAFCTTISDKSSNVGGVKGTRTGKFINEYLNDGNKPFNTNFIINSD